MSEMTSMGLGLGKAIVLLLLVWLVVIVLMTGPLYHSNDALTEKIAESVAKASEQVELLKRQYDEFRERVADLTHVPCSSSDDARLVRDLQAQLEHVRTLLRDAGAGECRAPALLERRVERGVRELWFYVNAQLRKLRELSSEEGVRNRIGEILEDAAEHKRTILVDVRNTSRGSDTWVAKELQELGDLVQRRIHFLQNPADCKGARKVVCNLNKGCGYGCQLHHAAYCFVLAYGMQRTLVLRSQGWRYNRRGWEAVFQPLSDTCAGDDADGGTAPVPWPGSADAASIQLPIVDALHPRPDFLPLAVPSDLLPRLALVHGDPAVWWVAQFVKFLLRPQPHTAKFLAALEAKVRFDAPIVGVHVRRTDKINTEAAFHKLEEYMEHVDDYFRTLALDNVAGSVAKRVYLASDDPGVLDEARRKYADYVFYGDASIAKSAAVSSRYSDDSLLGIIADIHLLSRCDYLVCTFSSQVCRVAYELMQTMRPNDASANFFSLDDVYYFGGQSAHNQRALQAHVPRDGRGEIALLPGDVVGIAGNHWDGYSKGVNRRTNQEGLYPSFKVEDVINAVDMPAYPEAEVVAVPKNSS